MGIKYIIQFFRELSVGRFFVAVGVVAAVFLLYRYKYFGLTLITFPNISNIMTPIGVSFLIFSLISYLVDVYKGADAGNLIDVALYISFFPKVISGPIILWKEFSEKLRTREVSIEKISSGICKLVYGFAKKAIIADYFGSVILLIQKTNGTVIDIPTAWLICILYMFQIYYDFAGYSDIAIGLSKIMGMEFDENFNFPYISTSISEFWRRWHISLGAWLRKYVYIPLGGNRKGKRRMLLNLFIVMVVSGIWHGEGVAYLLWGVMHGICIVFEKVMGNKNWYKKIPDILKWLLTMFIVMMGWEVFRLGNFSSVIEFLGILVGINRAETVTCTYQYYITVKLIVMLIIAFTGAVIFGLISKMELFGKLKNKPPVLIGEYIISIALFIVACVCITNGTYSPFIYFQY
ncbi:MAG: MBOAT family protein [Lachnospiraceae bacterium]|nr:MBOAT family protein [Lachnospiraceae bacterium]